MQVWTHNFSIDIQQCFLKILPLPTHPRPLTDALWFAWGLGR